MAWMKSFRASHGVTVESRGVWNRIDCAVEIELSEGAIIVDEYGKPCLVALIR